MKKVALVLSGGSDYGYAHIGVIEVLQENNIPIDIITGTSMGALIGGLYASGVSTEKMRKMLQGFSKRKMVDVNPLFLSNGGLIIGRKVTNILRKLIGSKNIEDCIIPFKAVATDIVTGKKYVFDKGKITEAIRASISVPLLFKPVRKDNMCLVDGGICDNLPVEDARNIGAEMVIAVDVCTYYKKQNNLRTMVDVVISSANLMVSNLVQTKKDLGDIYIKIDQPEVKFANFKYKDALKSIEYGREYALKMLPLIKKYLNEDL